MVVQGGFANDLANNGAVVLFCAAAQSIGQEPLGEVFNNRSCLPTMKSRKPTGPLNGVPSGKTPVGRPLPAARERARKDTGADGTREKTQVYFLSIVAPADGIKAAKLRKRRLRYITVLRAALSQATACLSSEYVGCRT
jgi:hypothetical protein